MQTDPAVLVVGAGPVGLVLAVDLARRGVPIRVFDELPVATTESRAVVVHARSLELMDALDGKRRDHRKRLARRHRRRPQRDAAPAGREARRLVQGRALPHVIALTTDITRAGTGDSHFVRSVRNHAMKFVLRLHPAQRRIANELEELQVNNRPSPLVGHVALVVPGGDGAPPEGAAPAGMRAVVAAADGAGGNGAVADPEGLVAKRYGLEGRGGIVVVRPDGYLGVISAIDGFAEANAYLAPPDRDGVSSA